MTVLVYMKITNPIGRKGEDLATEYLKKKGYEILERNYRKQYAEIDIIALSPDKVLVFVEVKTRTSNKFGTPLEAITHWKLEPLIKTAQFYKSQHSKLPESMRIDAIAVLFVDGKTVIEHMENIVEN